MEPLTSITICTTAGIASAAAEPFAHSEPGVIGVGLPSPESPLLKLLVPPRFSGLLPPALAAPLPLPLPLPPSTSLPSLPPQAAIKKPARTPGRTTKLRRTRFNIFRGLQPPREQHHKGESGRVSFPSNDGSLLGSRHERVGHLADAQSPGPVQRASAMSA
jgi:hypothetical protein